MMIALRLFGGAFLERDSGVVTGPVAQRHRLALLALLACSPTRSRPRDTLMALLWPDRDSEHARKLLNQAVYVVRRVLGEEVLLSVGPELRLDTDRLRCDVVAFEEAIAQGDLKEAVRRYTGPFLDGFHLGGSLEFERWLERERKRWADAYAEAVETLAERAEARGDPREAVGWWKHRVADDPYDSRVALRLLQALVSAGNPAGALRHAILHGRRLRRDLGIEPPADLTAFADRFRAESGPRTDSDPKDDAAKGEGLAADREGRGERARPMPRSPRAPMDPSAGEGRRSWLLFGAAALVLALAVLAVLQIETPAVGPEAPPPERRTGSIAALELYERASDPVLLRSAEGVRQGLAQLRRAVALDSTYAAAWAALAWMSVRRTADVASGEQRRELYAEAEEAARRAVSLDDALAEAHAALGFVRMVAAFDFIAAEAHLRRAVQLDPSQGRFREWLVGPLLWMGRTDEALDEAERALAIDSMSPSANAEVARALVVAGRCPEALTRLERLASLEPSLLRIGSIEAACRATDTTWLRTKAERTTNEWTLGTFGHLLGRAGATEEARRIRERLLDRESREVADAFSVAMVDAGLGRIDRAISGFERAIDDHSLMGTPDHFTMLDLVRESVADDPRFEELSRRMGLMATGPAEN